jgi:hypothetical protein
MTIVAITRDHGNICLTFTRSGIANGKKTSPRSPSLATICSPRRQIEPSYFRKLAGLENSNPDATCRCPRRPDTTKKVVDRGGLESLGCFPDCSMLVLLQIFLCEETSPCEWLALTTSLCPH